MKAIHFDDPLVLLLIPAVIVLWIFLKRIKRDGVFIFPSVQLLSGYASTWKTYLSNRLFLLRLLMLILLVIGLARPQSLLEESKQTTEGIDIVLAIDASGSMAAEDFSLNGQRVNRLAVVKDVVRNFIKERTADRIGIVAFGGLAYTVCPLTTDYEWLEKNIERVELGTIEDGTAIGSAISSALTRLKNSKAKSKIIILLTDGVNNLGKITPLEAARAGSALKIKIYTIGVGSKGKLVPFPAKDLWGRTVYQRVQMDLDEDSLRQIAEITSGKYFNANDTETLREVYEEINKLEKTKIEQTGYREYKELFSYFVYAVLILLLIEILLNNTVLLRIP